MQLLRFRAFSKENSYRPDAFNNDYGSTQYGGYDYNRDRLLQSTDEQAQTALNAAIDWIRNESDVQRDKARYEQVCCQPERYSAIANAPAPVRLVQVGQS